MALVSTPTKKKTPGPYIGTQTLAPWYDPTASLPKTTTGIGLGGQPGGLIGTLPSIVPTTSVVNGTTPPPGHEAPAPYNYLDALKGDPGYLGAINTYNNAIQAGRTQLKNQIQSAIIQGGWLPDFHNDPTLKAYADDLDAATIAAAQGNQMSQKAQLDRALQQSQTQLDYQLASRGTGALGRGGALTSGLANLQNQYDTQAYSGMQSLLGALAGNVSNYNALLNNAASTRDAAVEAAAYRLSQLPAPTPPPPPAAPPVTTPKVTTPPVETAAQRALRLRSEALNKLYGLR